ncbi:hypothetical protein CASFOL_010793 [Castilleja foliolosa]|uniref:DUF7795 domain-containing protein n=1 Tax=Castilleja foliolosa TaxID=1961234 RepID=A0ABD3DTN0_9LAMI
MVNEDSGKTESNDRIIKVYSDFMTRVTQFEKLVSMGSQLLVGFQQALGFLRRPPVDKPSPLVERIIKAHGSSKVIAYVEAGWVNSYDSQQNVSKLHTCHLGIKDHINQAKTVIDELECLMDDAASAVQNAIGKDEEEEEVLISGDSKPEVTDYAVMMAIIYSMVKQDYTMQVRIVSSLNHKSSEGELDTYCHMWSLRPFVDDDMMHKAWKLVS